MEKGLDKAARKTREKQVRQQAERVEPLNPPFPFRVKPFDPEFFGVPANPPESFERETR